MGSVKLLLGLAIMSFIAFHAVTEVAILATRDSPLPSSQKKITDVYACGKFGNRFELGHRVAFYDVHIFFQSANWGECLVQLSLEICTEKEALNRKE